MTQPESYVFFAYTRDGEQFDSIEALSADAAHADIALAYKDREAFLLGGKTVDITGFRVEKVSAPIGLHREVLYWSHRLAICAEPAGPNGLWVEQQFSIAHDAMMRFIG